MSTLWYSLAGMTGALGLAALVGSAAPKAQPIRVRVRRPRRR